MEADRREGGTKEILWDQDIGEGRHVPGLVIVNQWILVFYPCVNMESLVINIILYAFIHALLSCFQLGDFQQTYPHPNENGWFYLGSLLVVIGDALSWQNTY